MDIVSREEEQQEAENASSRRRRLALRDYDDDDDRAGATRGEPTVVHKFGSVRLGNRIPSQQT